MLEIQDSHNGRGKPVKHWIQTNGTLIDDTWCRFLEDNGIGISLSMDGPAHLNDISRLDWGGKSTFARVERALDCLQATPLL